MSLFGDDDLPQRGGAGGLARQSSSALFEADDHTAAAAKTGSRNTSNSLFDDGFHDDHHPDPWAFPTPKKQARGDVVKNLLPASEVPERYVDAYDQLLQRSSGSGSGALSRDAVEGLLQESGISSDTRARILDIVKVGDNGLGRNEFNVLFALVGLALEGDDATLDGVDERKKNLPTPAIPSLQKVSMPAEDPVRPETPPTSGTPQPQQPQQPVQPVQPPTTPPTRSRVPQKDMFAPEADPWGSPDLHRGHNHSSYTDVPRQTNGINSSSAIRTTSNFTSTSETRDATITRTTVTRQPSGGDGWGSFNPPAGDVFSPPGLGGEGFAPSGEGGPGNPSGVGRSLGGGLIASSGPEEVITVNTLPDKEGMFLFQHRNYEVASARRNSKVIRRYSDFVWLLDCLHKRYPFRQLPLLPPKRVAINGNHLATDAGFLEKRRRGLARFANALVRHPVLNQEQLVVMFLTVPTELAVWRKQATISVQEEFTGKQLPPDLEDSLPRTLSDLFDQVRSGVRRSAEIYINLCNMVERLCKRNEGIAAEYSRISNALQSLTEVSKDSYAVDVNDVHMLNEGLESTARHIEQSKSLLEDEAKASDEGVLEDLKRQRDCLVSMRDLFDRRDKYAKDNIPHLEKRIQQNEQKLQAIRAKPAELIKPNEAEKVEEAIVKDKQSIVNQHARGVFIKECIRDEILFFQQSQYHVSRLHQDWSQERVKYAELQADNWRALSDEVDGMPLGD